MFKSEFIKIVSVTAAAAITLFSLSSCGKEELPPVEPVDPEVPEVPEVQSGISDINNPYEDKVISYYGETISIKFTSSDDWIAELELVTDPDDKWAKISGATTSGTSKKGSTVRIAVDENESDNERILKLWVTVTGFEKECICTLKQAAAGVSKDAALNKALNTYMHDILKEDYLFVEPYLAQEIDLTVPFTEFLQKHLALGKANIADGGYYRASQENAGERFIYTNIVELAADTKAIQTTGLGFGPFISTALSEDSYQMGLAPSYVRRGSPAETAGLRRGDIIYQVNGINLTTNNYRSYMNILYQQPSGSYTFSFLRFEEDGNGGYALNAYNSGTATASRHVYDPVLHASVLTDPDKSYLKIGYLVYESFDIYSQDLLEDTINQFVEAGINELILDLRFNAGGAVAQSRWLSGCIAGPEYGDQTFTRVVYNDNSEENWTFAYGYDNDTDNLGLPVDLGLDRLYVITSYNTASAAELVINSLKGIDFPVKMIGCRTEGKNVGMTVSQTSYKGRKFQFSPVTFWVLNAKGEGDYQFGMEPDEYVNNDNNLTDDDADNVFPYSFGDWGNMDYNIALQWAYCDITGKPRWTHTPTKSSGVMEMKPVDFQSFEPVPGTVGSLIYE